MAVVVGATLVPVAGTDTARAATTALYPDIKTLPPRQLKLDRADISIDGSGVMHNLLRFSNTVFNAGQGPLLLNTTISPATRSGPATQRVTTTDGTYTEHPAGSFDWHEAHQHYHFDDWGVYQLWKKADYDSWLARGRSGGQTTRTGSKTTSCVLDEEFIANLPGTPFPAQYFGGCLPVASGNLRQVLNVGWGDTYDYWRAEQWIDLDQETLADGQYVLRSVTDPRNKLHESLDKSDPAREGVVDNEGLTALTVQNGALLDISAPGGTVSINNVDAGTQSAAVSVEVIGRDDVSGVDQLRLSNDATTWATFPYTSGDGSAPTAVSWDLADARYGGTTAGGNRVVYAQTRDRSGKWSATFTDTINLLTTAPPSAGYGGAVAGDGPVAYWRVGEPSGTSAADSMGTNTGSYVGGVTLGSASLTADTANTAASFDGVDDAVSVPSSPGLSVAGAVTVEAWVRPAAIPAGSTFASVVTKAESYSLQFHGPRLEFTTMRAGVRRRVPAPAGALVEGQRYHVVGTYDGVTQRLYVNGAQVASGPFSGSLSATGRPLFIGSWDGAGEFLAATVDDAAVYAKVLAPAQIADHYNRGTVTAQPPQPAHTLTIVRTGTGAGTVTSSFPVGINCPTTCSDTVANGTTVTLSGGPAAGSTFAGWSGGGCSGNGPCTTTVTADTTVTATFTTLTAPPSQGYAAAVARDGPVAYWRLGELSGTSAADSVGPHRGTYANGVTLGGTSLLASDTTDRAASFDGVNDLVSVTSSAALSPTGALTVEAWVRPTAKPPAGSFASVVTKTEAYSIQFNGPLLEFTTIRGSTRRRVQAPASAVVAGRTYHVVGTYDGGTQRLYVNGAQVASAAFSGPLNANARGVLLGSWDAAGEFLAGAIDEAAVYAKVLTPAQVADHHSRGATV